MFELFFLVKLMILNSDNMSKYRAYILYGKDLENLLKRIIHFTGSCKNIIAELSLKTFISRLCSEETTYVELKDYRDIDNVLLKHEEGKALIFQLNSPRDNIYSIALIPIDKYNKSKTREMVK